MDTVSAGSSAGSNAASAGQGTVPGQPHGRALRLRPLRADDEAAFAAAHAVMTGERFRFGIGYGVLPQYRRRGYATEILRQSLIIARAAGVDRVLVTCDEDNAGSRTVIESCGGQLDSVLDMGDGLPPKRRYWIG